MNSELQSTPQSPHLTEAQFAELLSGACLVSGSTLTSAYAHLLTCEQCAAEMDSLRESVALFRDATTAYAGEQLRRVPPVLMPARPMVSPGLRSLVLATASALILAAFLPMQMLHQRSRHATQQASSVKAATGFQHYAAESNEALLNDVDRAASDSVPDAMQALADPMGTADLSVQKSNQRKD